MIPAFAILLSQDIALLTEEDKTAAENELEHMDPDELIYMFRKA